MANESRSNMVEPKVQAISRQELNSASKVMIRNDGRLVPVSGVKPKIWTCSWYNQALSRSQDRENFCYKKGDAVWLNTEDLDQFVSHNKTYIKSIVMNNGLLKNEFQKIEGKEDLEFKFFKKVATGEITGNSAGLPLYYLGDVLQPTRIRVSLSSGNDKLPTDDAWWKDFFKNQDQSKFEEDLNTFFDQTLSSLMNRHLVEYHLSGITQYWHDKYGESKTLEDFYLLKDLSNVDMFQEYSATPGEDDQGFDYVLHFYKKTFPEDSTTCKWYRVWKSGYLEHGGIVKNDVTQAARMNDSLAYSGKFYKVNLSWNAEGSSNAPSYRYPINSGGFYMEDNTLDVGDGTKLELEDLGRVIDPASRYHVQVTPMMTTGTKIPYQTMHPASNTNGVYYLAKDIVSITNSTFCFLLDPDVAYYSYYTSGFASNVQQGFQ